jgi:hypothetical protein
VVAIVACTDAAVGAGMDLAEIDGLSGAGILDGVGAGAAGEGGGTATVVVAEDAGVPPDSLTGGRAPL